MDKQVHSQLDWFTDHCPDFSRVPWASIPTAVQVSLGSAGTFACAPSDPLRVVLVLFGDGTNVQGFVPSGFVPAAGSKAGLIVSANTGFVILTRWDHGLLVTLAWDVTVGAISHAGYIAQSVSRLPQEGLVTDVTDLAFREALRANSLPRSNRNGGSKLRSNRWRQPQALSLDDIPGI